MIFVIVLALLAAAILGALYYGYRLAFYYQDPQLDPGDYQTDDQILTIRDRLDLCIEAFQAAPFESVSITSRDGLTLTGQYYHRADGAPLQLQFHGYKGNALRDFCGVWEASGALGHNVLLVDQRCHGRSQGHTITFGIREREDCLQWIRYARERFGDVPMVLMGVSMGAATVLMASGMDLPKNVKGIVADCPYDSPSNIIKKVLGVEMGMPVKLVYPLIRFGARLYGGFDLESCSPLEAVQKSKTPILLIHGDADRFVPYPMSVNLHAAAPETIEFHTIPGAGHALNQLTDPESYRKILTGFIHKHIS